MGGCVYGIKIASTAKSHKVLDLVAEAVMVRFLAACSYGNIRFLLTISGVTEDREQDVRVLVAYNVRKTP